MNEKIFILEDDASLSEGLQIILQDEGYAVFAYSNNFSLEQNIVKHQPDLLLIDYRLQGKDGVSVIKSLKKQKKTQYLPIILMSASQKNMHQIAQDAGANAFLAKPFEINDLLLIVKNCLA